MNKLFIANPEGFTRRKYGGRGLGVANYKGWIYIGTALLLIVGFNYLGSTINSYFSLIAYMIGGLFLMETAYLIYKVYTAKLDERERTHEHATWIIVIVLSIGIIYQSYQSTLTGVFTVDRFILIALIAGALAKGITNIILDKKN